MVMFYSYGTSMPYIFADEGFAEILKEIYSTHSVIVDEKIPGLIGVRAKSNFILKFIAETLPILINEGRIQSRIIDEIISSKGLLSMMMDEMEKEYDATYGQIVDAFHVKKNMPQSNKKELEVLEKTTLEDYQNNYTTKVERLKEIIGANDSQVIISKMSKLADLISANEGGGLLPAPEFKLSDDDLENVAGGRRSKCPNLNKCGGYDNRVRVL